MPAGTTAQPPPLPEDGLKPAHAKGRAPLAYKEDNEDEARGSKKHRKREDQDLWDQLPEDLPKKVDKLGDPMEIYEPGAARMKLLLIFGVILSAAGPGLVIVGLVQRPKLAEFITAAVIVLCFGLPIIWYSISNLDLRVALFERGFLQVRRGKVDVVRFKDIESIWQHIVDHYHNFVHTHTSHIYTVQTYEGKRFMFDDRLENVRNLGESIQQAVMRVLLPVLMEEFEIGEEVIFGPLSLDRRGLSYGKHFLDWEDIQEVKLDKGYFVVRKKGKWLNWGSVATQSIPNFMVFMVMVDKIVDADDD